MVDMVQKNTKKDVDKELGASTKSPEKPFVSNLSSKLREFGLKNLDDLTKS